MVIVSNSGPLLSFARAHRFDLLREVVGTLTIPEAVYADIVVRGAAQQYGIVHFGSLRVLEEAKDRGLIPAVKPVLDELIAAGTFISEGLYRTFLRAMGEEGRQAP